MLFIEVPGYDDQPLFARIRYCGVDFPLNRTGFDGTLLPPSPGQPAPLAFYL